MGPAVNTLACQCCLRGDATQSDMGPFAAVLKACALKGMTLATLTGGGSNITAIEIIHADGSITNIGANHKSMHCLMEAFENQGKKMSGMMTWDNKTGWNHITAEKHRGTVVFT
jgi:hypothetical protein